MDPTGTVDQGVIFTNAMDVVAAIHGLQEHQGVHLTWNARAMYESGYLADGVEAICAAARSQPGKITLILDEVADVVIRSRSKGRARDADAVRAMVSTSKTGRQTGVSTWLLAQRPQEMPKNAVVDTAAIFGVSSALEWRYYEKEMGGKELVKMLEGCRDHRGRSKRAGAEERPYVEIDRSGAPMFRGPAASSCGTMIIRPQVGGGRTPPWEIVR